MSEVKKSDMLRQLHAYAVKGKVFTFAEMRDELGVDVKDTKLKNRCWNWFRAFRRDGIVEEVETERDRNKFYRIADRDQLDRLVVSRVGASPRPPVTTEAPGKEAAAGLHGFSGPDRLTRIEEKLAELVGLVAQVQTRQAELERKIDHLLAIWH